MSRSPSRHRRSPAAATTDALVYGRTAVILETLSDVYGRDKFMRCAGTLHPTLPLRASHAGAVHRRDARRARPRRGARTSRPRFSSAGGSTTSWTTPSPSTTMSRLASSIATASVKRSNEARRPLPAGKGGRSSCVTGRYICRSTSSCGAPTAPFRSPTGTGTEDWVRIPYEGKSELARVIVDPAVNVTLDQNLFNNGFRISPKIGARRTVERLTYFAELGLQGLLP